MSEKIEENHKIRLCGVKGCCPSLEFTDKTVFIEDDFGGKVKLTKEQWSDLKEKIRKAEI